jgi:uncharacterized protein YpuA (DUF1002 family)
MTGNNLHFRIRALALVVAAAITYCASGVASAQNGTAPFGQKPSLDQQLSRATMDKAFGELGLTGSGSMRTTTIIVRPTSIVRLASLRKARYASASDAVKDTGY